MRTSQVFPGDIRDVPKWTSYVKAVESFRITACESMHLVRRGHFRSRDKDGGHSISSVIPENTMLHAKFMALSVIKPELSALFCDPDLDPMTFIHELDPYSREIHRMCKYELRIRQGFGKLSSDRYTCMYTYIQTDRQNRPKLWTTPLRGWSII